MKFNKIFLILFIFCINFITFAEEIEQNQLKKLAQIAKREKKVVLNFDKVDIKILTYFVSTLTGKNILYPPDLKGEITLISNEPLSIEQVWDLYTTILKSRNYDIVEKKGYFEIVPSNIRNSVPPIAEKLVGSSELATFVYKIEKADIIQVANILRGLKSQQGLIFNYNPAKLIIITDTKNNIENLKQLISLIENLSEEEEIKIFKIKYSKSDEVATALNNLFADYGKKDISYKIVNLSSNNTIIVKAPKEIVKDVETIIDTIDIPIQGENLNYRRFWTVKLKNSKAEDIADVLNKVLENIQMIQYEISSQESKQTQETTEGKTEISTSQNQSMPEKKIITQPVYQKNEKPKIIAEKTTNILVIYANKAEYEAIKDLISDLDKPKKQVLVTALIAEVSEKALREIGVRWQILGSSGGATFRGGLSSQDFYNLIGSGNFVSGILTQSGKTVSISGNNLFFPDLLFLLSLLESGTGFNIISSPKILTLDNAEALINVSQVTPFASSLKFDVNGNPIINYDYKEVGLKLKVTPHISDNNIFMELHQETNEVIGYEKPQIGQISYVVPITSKREINTSIMVENGKTIILGGLVSKKTIDTMEGVPILSDIPVVGNLFKYKSNELNKTNLFVFLTPFIINSPEDIAKITEEHQKILEQLKKAEKSKEGK